MIFGDFSNSVDYPRFARYREKHNLYVIEDNCESLEPPSMGKQERLVLRARSVRSSTITFLPWKWRYSH